MVPYKEPDPNDDPWWFKYLVMPVLCVVLWLVMGVVMALAWITNGRRDH